MFRIVILKKILVPHQHQFVQFDDKSLCTPKRVKTAFPNIIVGKAMFPIVSLLKAFSMIPIVWVTVPEDHHGTGQLEVYMLRGQRMVWGKGRKHT